MQIKHFFLLGCLLITFNLFPSILANSTGIFGPSIEPKDACDLPAPPDFGVEDIGPTWVKLSWSIASPTIKYRVRTYTSAGNVLVSNILTPSGVGTVTVNGLQQGVTYYSKINTVCPDGTESPHEIVTPDFDTIITDLIVTGIQQSTNDPTCGVSNVGEYCEFSLDGSSSIFKIRPKNGSNSGKQFNVRKIIGADPKLRGSINNNSGSYFFTIDGYEPNDPNGTPGKVYQISYNSSQVAAFELYEHRNSNGTSVGRLRWIFGSTGYEIVRLTAAPNGLSGPSHPSTGFIRERDNGEDLPKSGLFATTAPNPFQESLEVFIPGIAENTQLQLFNLSGQKVLDQQFGGIQEQYTLRTENLSPGFYMLRIEADGAVQTLKVVKSE